MTDMYRTFKLSGNVILREVIRAIGESDPFTSWRCVYCGLAMGYCRQFNTDRGTSPTPLTRLLFGLSLLDEFDEATKLQQASRLYIEAIQQSVPLGQSFTDDQIIKAKLEHEQLDWLKDRLVDLLKTVLLLREAEDRVPQELRQAFDKLRALLDVSYGNSRENYVCFKLNFVLCVGR